MKRILPALLLATVAATAVARPGFVGAPPHPPSPGLAFLEVMADEIGLTVEQESTINELVDASRLASAVDRERMSQIREQLQALSRNDENFDEAAAGQLADEMAGIASRMAVNGAQLRWDIRQVLTPEQRDQLEGWRGTRTARFVRGGEETEF